MVPKSISAYRKYLDKCQGFHWRWRTVKLRETWPTHCQSRSPVQFSSGLDVKLPYWPQTSQCHRRLQAPPDKLEAVKGEHSKASRILLKNKHAFTSVNCYFLFQGLVEWGLRGIVCEWTNPWCLRATVRILSLLHVDSWGRTASWLCNDSWLLWNSVNRAVFSEIYPPQQKKTQKKSTHAVAVVVVVVVVAVAVERFGAWCCAIRF